MKDMPVSFPGLFGDWELNIDPVAIHVGHGIYWYGIILAVAMLAGLYLCMKQAKHYGLTEDNVMDMVLWAVPCCIIGARLYYILFYLDLYRKADGSLDWGAMVRIWDGGLAIYGAVIAGVIVALIYTKRHKIPFFAMGDLAVMGLLLAFGVMHPNAVIMLLIPPIPMKAKWFVIIYAVIELFLGWRGVGNVAHFAHVGGMLWGFLLLHWWKRRGTIRF